NLSTMSSTSPFAESRQISSAVQQQSIPEEEEEEEEEEEKEEKQQQQPKQKQTISSEQQEQNILYNLPVPYLMNTTLEGRRVPYLVLAFPFDFEDQLRCAEVNNMRPDLQSHHREIVALSRVRRMLPRHCDIDPIRWKNQIGFIMAVIVASNATRRSLALMHDIDRLKEVQRILGTNKCPRWAKLKPDDY
ncbi:hypothetical protein C0993_005891, partial [Termitomyces sp. T159_Od127]